MKNHNIANIQLQISENCSDLEKEILHFHWKLNPQLDFINRAAATKKAYDLKDSEAAKILYNKSKMLFYLFCKSCNSYEKQSAKSQTEFLRLTTYSLKCKYCVNNERAIRKAEIQEFNKQQKLQKETAMLLSYQNKEWITIPYFEKNVLHKAIQLNFQELQSYFKTKQNSNAYWRTLHKLNDLHIIKLSKNDRGYIDDIFILDELKETFVFTKEEQTSKALFNSETNELKFKLLINTEQYHPDSPLYAGSVTFKEKIIIEPNVEYTFAQWERVRNQLYLTMIPTSELEKAPIVKSISKQPKHIKKHINNYLKNIGKDLDF